MQGWITLHRKLSENPLWQCEKFTRGQAWVDLILLANHKKSFFYKRGVKIDVERGQCAWSELALSHRWQWSRSKVRKFLNELEKEHQIKQQKTNVTQVITLINYEKYQQKEQQTEQQKNNRKTPKEQQKDTNNNDNNVEGMKNNENKYTDFIEKFNLITGKKIRVPDKKFKGQLNARLSEGFTVDEILKAADNCKKDKYHMENPKYLTPEFITRADKLQKFLNTETKKRVLLTEKNI